MNRLLAFIRLTRPVFLLGPVLLHGLGASMAVRAGAPFSWVLFALGQCMITSAQLMTQYANEFYDQETDRRNSANRTMFSGGSGVLSLGLISPTMAAVSAMVCASIATGAAISIGLFRPPVAILGACMILGGWYYSAPPFKLMSSGWGEMCASIIVAVLVPVAGFVLFAGVPNPAVFAVCAPLFCLHMAMLLAFEFADFEADRDTGKRTLTVRLGRRNAAHLHNASIVIGFGFYGLYRVFAPEWSEPRALVYAFPIAVWQIVYVRHLARRNWAGSYAILTFGAVLLFSATAGLWFIAYRW